MFHMLDFWIKAKTSLLLPKNTKVNELNGGALNILFSEDCFWVAHDNVLE